MKRWATIFAIGVGSLGLAGTSLTVSATEKVLEGIAAQVGPDIVLISEVDQMANPLEERMTAAGMGRSDILMMRADALERLIDAKIINQVVRRTELGASDEEVDGAIASIARENGLSSKQLQQTVSSHGLGFEEYRLQIKHEIERSKILSTMVRSRVYVEPEEAEELYLERYGDQRDGGEQVHLNHILIAAGPGAMRNHQDACGELEGARKRIIGGQTTFKTAAQSLSDIKAETGGDLGWMHVSDLAAWMAPAVEPLQPGQVSTVVETNFGCNLLMVKERRGFAPVTFDQAKPELENEIYRRKTEEEYVRWLDKLRDQTYIERKGSFSETTRLLQQGQSRGGIGQ
jgi:peptidyl-prolyl cis-trans isomerase SurA